MNNIVLTQDQEEACTKFKSFLLSDEKEFYLFGAAGSGKTFLINYFISQVLKDYKKITKVLGIKCIDFSVHITASTNKAVEVLKQSIAKSLGKSVKFSTVYSLFKVTVGENYSSGKTFLKFPKATYSLDECIIIVDECSMLPKEMTKYISEHTKNCKIIYVGDSYQLAPVGEKPYWNNTPKDRTATLNIPVRNANSQALIDLCKQLRETVETLQFNDISLAPNAIEHLNMQQAIDWLTKADYDDSRVLCYTNQKAIQYIKWIENTKKHTQFLRENSTYVNNYGYFLGDNFLFYPEQLVKVVNFKSTPHKWDTSNPQYAFDVIEAEVYPLTSRNTVFTVTIALDPEALKNATVIAANNKDWVAYFAMKKKVMDLRLPYASTIHKAQGSTFKEVLIDLNSFKMCTDPLVAARLLYVAVSRAQEKVLFYGDLPKRYGRLV